MSEDDALALMERKLGEIENIGRARKLASVLEHMPLAIVQATSYIAKRAPRISLQRYLKKVQQSEAARKKMLDHEGGQLRRDREAQNSIILTWQISFDHIRDVRPSAADLLSLMSFCDRQGIPQALLQEPRGEQEDVDSSGNKSDNDDSESISTEMDLFEEDIQILRDYSFITVNMDLSTFEMHSLVQLSTRTWLETKNQLDVYLEKFIVRLQAQMPTGDHKNRKKCQIYLPHAKAAARQYFNIVDSDVKDTKAALAIILYKAAWYMVENKQADEAERMAMMALRIWLELFGLQHRQTLFGMKMISEVLVAQGRLSEAEGLQKDVTGRFVLLFGMSHPNTLVNLSHLATIFETQGRLQEAEQLQTRVMETQERTLGLDHSNTVNSMYNLAAIYEKQGRWEEEAELRYKVIKHNKMLAADDPVTLRNRLNLAAIYWQNGRYEEAQQLQVELFTAYEKRDVEDEEAAMSSRAMVFSSQNRLAEAEELEVKVLELSKQRLGEYHLNTLIAKTQLAGTLIDLHRADEAERLYAGVWEIRRRELGANHPETLTSMDILIGIFWRQERWNEAEELLADLVDRRIASAGIRDLCTLASMQQLALVRKEMGRDGGAISLLKECIQLQISALGTQHPCTADSLTKLAEWESDP